MSPPVRPTQAWLEQIRLLNERARSMNAEKASRISPSAMSEILSALDDYWDVIEASDLGQGSKGIYFDMAENFIRWMQYDFAPGCRKTFYRVSDSNQRIG